MSVSVSRDSPARPIRVVASPVRVRLLLAAITVAALVTGFVITGADEASRAAMAAGPDLTRLMRAMAGLKAVMALGLAAAVIWRLGTPITAKWFAAYALACAAMAAGPGLIWDMDHVRAGAVALHGGLLAGVLLLWRDPAVGQRLDAMIQAKRLRLAARQP